ncbi:hypothetical protein [Methylobacterium longum]|uniref:Uncharacterized protein n=1 Tax=Methylobacterium longum TaxID=767694 RepID=A0ABT8AX98_9HYPH|nr:hypothetical protein [Methylobacterium longum]MDN3574547.1 hypothetical protein [Methylobacterium longum]GJE09331.1 hypothetical protein FOHLNKBM_0354 [Methylobacterium longum]
MSLQRRISWNAALRDARDDRARVPAGLLSAKARIDLTVRLTRRPLFAAGQFNRGAIMSAAVAAARAHQERFGGTWGKAMSVCLTAAWRSAKLARHMTAN